MPIYENKIVLLKQLRPPYTTPFLNIVMGGMKNKETPVQAAKRECIEEIGVVPKQLTNLGKIIQLPGSANIETYLFISRFIERPAIPGSITEPILDFFFYSKKEIKRLIERNKIVESTTLVALLLTLKANRGD